MKTCPYCATEVTEKPDSKKADCTFCEMEITPSNDGERSTQQSKFKMDVVPKDMELPTKELMKWNTLNLMQLLKLLREERREYFNHIRTFKKAGNETDQFKDMEKQMGEEYEGITRKTWAVENILRDRIGYVPRRVTQNSLEVLYERMEHERNIKPMVISRSKDKDPPPRQTMER